MDNKIWYLRQNRLFADVAAGDVERYAGLFTMITYAKRARVFDLGDPTRLVYLIKSGAVRITKSTEDGKEVTVAALGVGDLFGEEAVFSGHARTTVAVCTEETLVCTARAEDIFAMLSADPSLAMNVAQMLSRRLEDATAAMEDLAFAKIADRIVHLFERLAVERGTPVADGMLIEAALTHAEIASMIGSTRETVTLEIGRLVRGGRLSQRDGCYVLPYALAVRSASAARP